MKYKDKVSQLLETVENRLVSLKKGMDNNMMSKDEAFRQIDLILRELGYAQDTVDLEERDF